MLREIVGVYICLTVFLFGDSIAAAEANPINISYDTSTLNHQQRLVLDLLNRADTLAASQYWPAIEPSLFFSNVRNVSYFSLLCVSKCF
jgi:hypothetical protein